MTKTMSIRARLVLLAGIGAAVASLLGGAGLYGLQQARMNSEWLEASAVSVRAAMDADMMHDAIRAEVLRAALAAQQGQLDEVRAAERALTEDFATLTRDLATAIARAPGAAAVEAAEAARPVAERYGATARATVQHLLEAPQDSSVLAEFDTAFHALEAALERSADAIEASAGEASDASRRFNDRASIAMLAVVSAGLAFLLLCSVWVIRSVLQPLFRLRDAVTDLNHDDGDLSRRLPAAAAEFGEVASLFNAFLDKIARVVGRVQVSAREISAASLQIAAGNDDLSRRTIDSAGQLKSAAGSVDAITSHVRDSADTAREADALAGSASSVAARGGAAVSRVVETMAQIDRSSRRIADIIGVIDGIAFQTNILALNAAVEAARAGEQGRGFAVVAGEVRSLAQRSASAAREIKGLIEASVGSVDAGSRYVQEAGDTMGEIVASVDQVGSMIRRIADAAHEQSSGIGRVNQTVNELDRSTQQNAGLVEQTAAAAQQLAAQAQELAASVSVFRTDPAVA